MMTIAFHRTPICVMGPPSLQCNKCGEKHPSRAPRPPRAADRRADQAAGLDTGLSYVVGGADRGQKRTGEGGGFREFDEQEENRRKRRAQVRELLVCALRSPHRLT